MSKKQSRHRDTLGFDLSTVKPPNLEYINIKCSQCAALVISGVATHEHGCPNWATAKQREREEEEDSE